MSNGQCPYLFFVMYLRITITAANVNIGIKNVLYLTWKSLYYPTRCFADSLFENSFEIVGWMLKSHIEINEQ